MLASQGNFAWTFAALPSSGLVVGGTGFVVGGSVGGVVVGGSVGGDVGGLVGGTVVTGGGMTVGRCVCMINMRNDCPFYGS